ncbi:MAG: DUF4349 domain-containing protein [Bacteroidales bacterium]|jgi:hypothetical protein|nr:DUF4349 domain-containing protein [Bacteroidales bacterium]MDD4671464.1 DUF4349 domain-containing protein [Bacteroidales bacterium]MDY0347910.1 DUF4349 domain-containing protein [Tenuifilaceae bacterium]
MKNILTITAAVCLIAIGCGSISEKNADSFAASDTRMVYRAAPEMDGMNNMVGRQESSPTTSQKLIKTANISMEVTNYKVARQKIDSITKRYYGWVSSENMTNYDHRITNTLAIRVPAERLDTLITKLLTVAKKIESQSVRSTDVTEEYIDIESRLKNQRAVEKKFIALLQRTNNISQILEIESKLADIRSQIESTEGRMRYLSNRVGYSTINLTFYQKIDYKYDPEPAESFGQLLKKSFYKGWAAFVQFVLFIAKLWPFWILIAITSYSICRYRKKRRGKEMQKKENNKHSSTVLEDK